MEITTKYSPLQGLFTSIVTSPAGTQLRNTTTDKLAHLAWLAKASKSSMARATSAVLAARQAPGRWVRA